LFATNEPSANQLQHFPELKVNGFDGRSLVEGMHQPTDERINDGSPPFDSAINAQYFL